MAKARAILGGLLALNCAAYSATLGPITPRIAVATSDNIQGRCDSVGISPPWEVLQNLEPLGPWSRLRYFYDRLYAVNRSPDEIQAIDPVSFDTILTLRLARDSMPEDILVVAPDRAFVSLYNSTAIAIVDPIKGLPQGSIDLGAFADTDGLPEMSMMARDGDRLFVQIQRIDRTGTGIPVPPSWLAVVDLKSETLIDVDPDLPGVQGVRLIGTVPNSRMHVDRRARRLFVSTPGPRLNVSGGIEEVDLDTLQSLGFVLSEADVGVDLGGFVMVSPDAGYVLGHTDIVASSHLAPFSRDQGVGDQILMAFGFIDALAIDPITSQLFFPDPFSMPFGVHVIDTRTNEILTRVPLATGLPPWDLTVVRRTTAGEATDLQVTGPDPQTGALSLTYRPACGATDHTLVIGPLDQVGAYGYSGQICGIGTGGTVEAFNPGEGSFFFLVAGTGDEFDSGSYGAGSAGVERPEFGEDPACPFVQDLTFACDR